MLTRISAILAAFTLAVALPLTVQAAYTPHWVHYKLLNGSTKPPTKLVILPSNVEVLEVTAGGVKEEVPEWSAEAKRSILESISTSISKDASLQEVKMPSLSSNENDNMEEHIALYKLVANTAADVQWQHKIRRFDYSIGPGLKTVQRKTGADAAVIIYGRDYASTAGRKTKAVLGHIPIVNIFTGPAPKLGHSFIHMGIIDLRTGDLLWMNSEYRDGTSNLREYDDAQSIVSELFNWYPGIEEYRSVYVK